MSTRLQDQLRFACRGAGAAWAAVAARPGAEWLLLAAHGLSARKQTALIAWLAERPFKNQTGIAIRGVTDENSRLTIFRVNANTALLVGAKTLSVAGRAVFQAVAASLPPEASASPGGAFADSLQRLRAGLGAEAALLARWVAGEAQIGAIWQMPAALVGLAFAAGPELAAEDGSVAGDLIRRALGLKPARKYSHWLALPIRQGQRVLGLALFSRRQPFTPTEHDQATRQAAAEAPALQQMVLALEARQALARQQLLEDLSALSALELDFRETARRIQRLLQRHFPAADAEILLLSRDQKCLEALLPRSGARQPLRYALDSTLVGAVYRIGQSVRIGNFASQNEFASPRRGVAAKMAAPLALPERVLGVLALESRRAGAFSAGDEQALVLAARLTTGLLESARLRTELAEQTRALENLNRLVETLAGQAPPPLAGSALATWAADQFQADLALVMLLDPDLDELVTEGIAGRRASSLPRHLRFARHLGAPGEALEYGRSLLIHDAGASGEYFPVAGWEGGAALCVPLAGNGESFGALLVERAETYSFRPTDLLVLEAAARLAAPALQPGGQPESQQAALAALQAANATMQAELEARTRAQDEAEERLLRSARLAAVGEMAAGVAHELNNPLTTVTGFTELILEQTAAESPLRGDLELVLNEARRARGVVRRLLDFSRPSEILRVDADLNEELLHVLGLVHHAARTSGVEMRLTLWDDLPPVRIDRSQMQQVFLNLVQNAIQALPQGGQLTLRTQVQTRAGQEYVTASVTDSGEGIRPEHLSQVFEPFFTTKPAGSGTGLGLSVSYGIVADHGGFIDVLSPAGEGATFTVWLPLNPTGGEAHE